MDRMLDTHLDKRTVYDLDSKNKLLHEKNRTLFTEVVSLRKEMEQKESEFEKMQLKVYSLEKKLVFASSKL